MGVPYIEGKVIPDVDVGSGKAPGVPGGSYLCLAPQCHRDSSSPPIPEQVQECRISYSVKIEQKFDRSSDTGIITS